MQKVASFSLKDTSTATLRAVSDNCESEYILLETRPASCRFVDHGLERMCQIADYTGAAILYSDRFFESSPAPVIDYQSGSLRDDFDFGALMLFRTSVLRRVLAEAGEGYRFAGLYDARLRASRLGPVVHAGEFLYYEDELDKRLSGEKLFDYVNPRNREVQIEMEAACTAHLKALGAFLEPVTRKVDLSEGTFPVEASVIIPCRNRVRTIGDAIRSALSQKCSFPFNVFVVDDNSTDGTVEVIKSFQDDPRLVYIAQDPGYHAIGGNWNAAVHHSLCGRFCIQLDSDDVYSSDSTLEKIVAAFRSSRCAMVIGSYRLTDINLNELPPGVIDHREWTPENGHNNALRINGLGAPRGFWTPLLREINFPVTKYGGDYAGALRRCREYQIGRIYEPLYNCRRWNDNSDAALDIVKVNANNLYKDSLRSWELAARIRMNKGEIL